MNCPVHLRPMTEVSQIPPSWVVETMDKHEKRQKRARTILRCGIKDCPQVGFEFDAAKIVKYFCSTCGRLIDNSQKLGINARCAECRNKRVR